MHGLRCCRARTQEGLLRARHVQALEQLEDAAGQCQLAGHGSGHLEAVSDFIRQELREHFHDSGSAQRGPASFVSRTVAGVLLIGGAPRHTCMHERISLEAVWPAHLHCSFSCAYIISDAVQDVALLNVMPLQATLLRCI